MSNIDKMRVGSTTYDIADSTARSNVGDLTQLNTTDKTSLVGAINEVVSSGSQGGGLTNEIKEALLDCFEHVAWIDEDGQDYYDALHDALYPPANLVSISAVYTQSGTVYTTDSLDSLKSDLVVTAHFDDNTTQTVTTYTLSGTLTVGTSTIIVSYGGKTTTFTVTVTERLDYITIDATLPLTVVWNSGTYYDLTETLGADGKEYVIEVTIDSVGSASAYLFASAKGANGETTLVNFSDMAGQTGTLSKHVWLTAFTAEATTVNFRGRESSVTFSSFKIREVTT